MAFSGALTITDLDDFLTPSQACIIPVRNGKAQSDLTDGSTEIHIDGDNNYYEVSTYSTATAFAPLSAEAGPSTVKAGIEKKALEKAEINLNDCLACSGCITSTESLLITLQSQTEVLSFIEASTTSSAEGLSETRRPFLSISPQTLASLSAYHSALTSRPPLPLLTLLQRIRSFLGIPARGAWVVGDTTFARHLSLRESVLEYEERRAYAKGKWVDRAGNGQIPGALPILASACPGWVCYAEKAQGDLLPLMSATRSSQGVIGGLVKQYWGGKAGLKPSEIYHVTAMPCYDKKLEASRSDFYSEIHATREVDCVLTTGELDVLLQDLGFDPYALGRDETPQLSSSRSAPSPSAHLNGVGPALPAQRPWPDLLMPPGTASGSYLHTLLSHVGSTHPSPTAVHTRKIRDSPDNEEYILHDVSTGEALFKGAKVYGFRNLQNLVRRVGKETGLGKGKGAGKLGAAVAARRKKGRVNGTGTDTPGTGSGTITPGTPGSGSGAQGEDVARGLERMKAWDDKKLDYVEVMACPSGCVNGGGQMKPVTASAKAAAVAADVSSAGVGLIAKPSVNGMEVDREGYPRPLPDPGTDSNTSTTPAAPKLGDNPNGGEESEEGWRWSTKEWVQRVEEIYWTAQVGLPTPPESPILSGDASDDSSSGEDRSRKSKEQEADDLAESICQDVEVQLGQGGRWEFLRTRFRRVEGDVLGGSTGVTLEAVKW